MSIAKIIKIYFIFVMAIVATASLTYSDNIQKYMATAFNFDNSLSTMSMKASIFDNKTLEKSSKNEKILFSAKNDNKGLINFDLNNDPSKLISAQGTQKIEIAKFDITTYDEDFSLENLKLKIDGIDSKNLLNVVLSDGAKIISEPEIIDEYLNFEDINYKVLKNSKKTLFLFSDLSNELKTGERFRVEIFSPDDISILVGDKPYFINAYYPIKSSFLSIAKSRSWGRKK